MGSFIVGQVTETSPEELVLIKEFLESKKSSTGRLKYKQLGPENYAITYYDINSQKANLHGKDMKESLAYMFGS